MAESRKRQSIPISRKVEIIKYIEANPSKKQTEIAEKFGMNAKTLNHIVKAKTKIMEGAGNNQMLGKDSEAATLGTWMLL